MDSSHKYPTISRGEKDECLEAEIFDFVINGKWTCFVLKINNKLYSWCNKLYKVRKALFCSCPKDSCVFGYIGKKLTIKYDGHDWEPKEIPETERCKNIR